MQKSTCQLNSCVLGAFSKKKKSFSVEKMGKKQRESEVKQQKHQPSASRTCFFFSNFFPWKICSKQGYLLEDTSYFEMETTLEKF